LLHGLGGKGKKKKKGVGILRVDEYST